MKLSPSNIDYIYEKDDIKLSIPKAQTYDDVLLVPQYSDIRSRAEVNIGSMLDGPHAMLRLSLPIISSPMDTISEEEMGVAMWQEGGLAVIHRYNTIERQLEIVDHVITLCRCNAAAAIGTSGDYLERARALVTAGVRILCVDVAHGGFQALVDWGADSVRVGIGGGSICTTRIQTGHGVPGLQTIFDCAKSDRGAPIIADGGIRNAGDIVKALAAGADFVMLGSLLAGTDEAPGDVINTRRGKFKSYRGMASKDAQIEWHGKTASLEGIATTIPCKGPVEDVLEELSRGIRSGFSYSGARTLTELQSKAKFVSQTSAGAHESSTHILKR